MNKFFISILFIISGAYAMPDLAESAILDKASETVAITDKKDVIDSEEALKNVEAPKIDAPRPSRVLDIMMQASKLILKNQEGEVSDEAALAFVNAKMDNKYENHSINKESISDSDNSYNFELHS